MPQRLPLVSIIVPVYKVEKYLGKCIKSILSQSYQCWELLLVDDGSPDRSGQICDEYAEKDTRIRVFHKDNAGVSSARNFGLDSAKGEFVMFVDSDDWISTDCLQVCVDEIEKDKLDALQFGFISVTDGLENSCVKTSTIPLSGEKYIQNNSFNVCAGGGIYKREIIEEQKLRFPEELKLAEDQIFVLSFFKNARCIKYLDQGLYYYLQREESAVHNQKSKDMLLSCKYLISLSKDYPAVKGHVDSMIVLFIIEMIRNHDVSYRIMRQIYKEQHVGKVATGYKIQRLFPKLASVNFSFACFLVSLYLKK